MTSPAPVIEVRDLHKIFPVGFRRKKVYAVKGISFEVQQDDIFGFLGPNGAGKTTSIKVLTGLIRPSRGQVRMFGRDVEDLEVRRRLGFLPEQPYFYDYLTPVELLDHFGRLFGVPRAERARRIEELLASVGLRDARSRTLRKFSKGMLQRVGIAQALINDPDLVIFDEPLTGLDPIGRKEIMDLVVSLKERGKTVFFSSHILSDIERVCDRVAILRAGHLVAHGTLDELLTRDGLLVEIEFQMPGGADPGVPFETVERLGGRTRGQVDEPRVEATLTALIQRGARILSVVRRRQSLEDLFLREAIRRDDSEGAQPQAPGGKEVAS
jgi:ABC-2 type transport system ATP-binding protein